MSTNTENIMLIDMEGKIKYGHFDPFYPLIVVLVMMNFEFQKKIYTHLKRKRKKWR